MEKLKLSLRGLLFLLLIALTAVACNTAKKGQTENTPMTITLKEGLTSKYFLTNYNIYEPTDISLANRTTNQYRVNFSCTSKSQQSLLAALEADKNVIAKTLMTDKTNTDVQSGTNDGHSKVKPIKSNKL